jgi:hypothetical protein
MCLRFQSVLLQITNTVTTPEVAFTGDTMSDFILDPDNVDVLKAKILVVEVNAYSILGV